MNDMADKFDLQFYQLVVSLHAAAMQQMGKIASPLSGKIERDMIQAKGSIDLLEMLKRKTEGNLTDDERRTLVEWIDLGALWSGDPQADTAPRKAAAGQGGTR